MNIEVYDCVVRYAGRMDHEIALKGVTVPEMEVLRLIHTPDAVTKLTNKRIQNVNPRTEKERLLEKYGRNGTRHKEIEALFPGAMPRLPRSVNDLAHFDGVVSPAVENDEPKVESGDEPDTLEAQNSNVSDDDAALDDEDADFSDRPVPAFQTAKRGRPKKVSTDDLPGFD